jgi:hypothetical protein
VVDEPAEGEVWSTDLIGRRLEAPQRVLHLRHHRFFANAELLLHLQLLPLVFFSISIFALLT